MEDWQKNLGDYETPNSVPESLKYGHESENGIDEELRILIVEEHILLLEALAGSSCLMTSMHIPSQLSPLSPSKPSSAASLSKSLPVSSSKLMAPS